MDKQPSPECPFCASKSHHRPHSMALKGTGNETTTNGMAENMEKLIKYVKEIGFFDGIKKKKIFLMK
jgi:hypothetical protein